MYGMTELEEKALQSIQGLRGVINNSLFFEAHRDLEGFDIAIRNSVGRRKTISFTKEKNQLSPNKGKWIVHHQSGVIQPKSYDLDKAYMELLNALCENFEEVVRIGEDLLSKLKSEV